MALSVWGLLGGTGGSGHHSESTGLSRPPVVLAMLGFGDSSGF